MALLSTPTGFERLGVAVLYQRVQAAFQDQDVSAFPKMAWVARSLLLEDIRFRGATGDFAGIKAEVEACPMERVLVRAIDDDVYGDASNVEIALSEEVAAAWEAVEAERDRRRRRDALLATLPARGARGPSQKRKRRKRKNRADW